MKSLRALFCFDFRNSRVYLEFITTEATVSIERVGDRIQNLEDSRINQSLKPPYESNGGFLANG